MSRKQANLSGRKKKTKKEKKQAHRNPVSSSGTEEMETRSSHAVRQTARPVAKGAWLVNRTAAIFCKIVFTITCILLVLLAMQSLSTVRIIQGDFRAGPTGKHQRQRQQQQQQSAAKDTPPSPPPPQSPDHYTILQIPLNATNNEIKRAYRKQVEHIHPDKVQRFSAAVRLEAEAQYKLATKAYESLLDAEKRCTYDKTVMGGAWTAYMSCLERAWQKEGERIRAEARAKAEEEAAEWEARFEESRKARWEEEEGTGDVKEEGEEDREQTGRESFFEVETPFTAVTLVTTLWERLRRCLYNAYCIVMGLVRLHR